MYGSADLSCTCVSQRLLIYKTSSSSLSEIVHQTLSSFRKRSSTVSRIPSPLSHKPDRPVPREMNSDMKDSSIELGSAFTDGPPYWPEDSELLYTGPKGNDAYQRALSQFSANYSASLNGSIDVPSVLVETPPEPDPAGGTLMGTARSFFGLGPSATNHRRGSSDRSPTADSTGDEEILFRATRPAFLGNGLQAQFENPGLLKDADFYNSGMVTYPQVSPETGEETD